MRQDIKREYQNSAIFHSFTCTQRNNEQLCASCVPVVQPESVRSCRNLSPAKAAPKTNTTETCSKSRAFGRRTVVAPLQPVAMRPQGLLPLAFLMRLLRSRSSGSTVMRWRRDNVVDSGAIGCDDVNDMRGGRRHLIDFLTTALLQGNVASIVHHLLCSVCLAPRVQRH